MKSTFTVPLFQLCGFAFSLFAFGLVLGMALVSRAHAVLPIAILAVSVALTSAGLVKASRRVS